MLEQTKTAKLNFKDYLVLIHIGTVLMPIAAQIIHTYLLVFLVCFLNLIFCIDIMGKLKGESAWCFLALLLPIALTFFEGVTKGQLSIIFLYRILINTLLIFMGLYYTLIASKERAKKVFMIAIGMLVVTSITSIVVLATDPLAARIMATIGDSADSYAVSMNMRNLGGFSIVYLCVGILSFFLYMAKQKEHRKIVWIGSIILISIYIFMASYTTAILIGFLSIIFTLFGARAKKQSTVIVSFLFVGLLIFFFRYQIADLFYELSDATVDIVSNRLKYLADSIYGIDSNSDAQTRVDYYQKAWQSFLSSPLIGGEWLGTAKTSGHSYILDMMAKYGLFGLLVLFLEYKAIYKLFYRTYKREKTYYYSMLSFAVCIALALLNPSENFFLLLVFLPMGLKAMAQEEPREET